MKKVCPVCQTTLKTNCFIKDLNNPEKNKND